MPPTCCVERCPTILACCTPTIGVHVQKVRYDVLVTFPEKDGIDDICVKWKNVCTHDRHMCTLRYMTSARTSLTYVPPYWELLTPLWWEMSDETLLAEDLLGMCTLTYTCAWEHVCANTCTCTHCYLDAIWKGVQPSLFRSSKEAWDSTRSSTISKLLLAQANINGVLRQDIRFLNYTM